MIRAAISSVCLLVAGCASQEPVHYNHLRINQALRTDDQVVYRDLTTPYVPQQYLVGLPEEAIAEEVEPIEPEPSHSCGDQFLFQPGLLRENMIDALSQCGYSLGSWNLGNHEYMIDIPIRSAFTVDIEEGVDDILAVVTEVYGIRGEVDPITKSVHFSRAIAGVSE